MGFGWKSILGVAAAPFTGGLSLALTAADQIDEQNKAQQEAQEEAEQAQSNLLAQQIQGAKDLAAINTTTATATTTEALEKSIATLVDVIKKQPTQPVYVTPAAEPTTAAPNYIIIIVAGAVVFYLFTRLKPK